MAINLIQSLFYILSLITVIVYLFFRFMDYIIPTMRILSSRYDKYTYFVTQYVCISQVEVPEKWFKHFYKLPIFATSLLLAMTISRFFYNTELSEIIYSTLDFLLGSDRKALVAPETTLLAVLLLTIHCAQRFYELHFVSKFDDEETREMTNFIFAPIHYIALIAAVIGESEGFVRDSSFEVQWNRLTNSQLISAALLVVASIQQLTTNRHLAKLADETTSGIAKLPRGGLFEYVSGAIEFTETIVYLMLAIVLRQTSTFHYIFLWTLANEAIKATFSYFYHRRNCPEFPKNRKAFIPFIY